MKNALPREPSNHAFFEPFINDALCLPLFFISFSVREIAGARSLHFLCTASLPSKITSILQGSFPPPPPPRTPFSWHPVLLMGDVVPFHWWSLRPFYWVGIHLFIYLIIHSSNKHLLNTYSTPDLIFDVRDTKLKKKYNKYTVPALKGLIISWERYWPKCAIQIWERQDYNRAWHSGPFLLWGFRENYPEKGAAGLAVMDESELPGHPGWSTTSRPSTCPMVLLCE